MNAARGRVEDALAGVAGAVARTLPRRVAHRVGGSLGRLVYTLGGRRRRIALDNLAHALPDLSPTERRGIARDAFRTVGRNAIDLLTFDRYGVEDIGQTVTVDGWDHLADAHARGRGVLLVTGHYGHWELTALMQGYLGLPMRLLHRPLDNPRLEARLLRLRGLSGNRPLSKRGGLRPPIRALRAGEILGFVFDQDARHDGKLLPFLGRPASTTLTPALLALRTGAAVVPTFCVGDVPGRYRIHYEAPIPPPEEPGGDDTDRAARWMARLNERLEAWVRRHPEQWFWMHRRWKTRQTRHDPPGAPLSGGEAANPGPDG